MQTSALIYKDLVLVGGGHSHALVLKMWAMKPLPGVRLTLISPQVLTPYSGMLPGLIAGHYGLEETHIDLARLCRFANARFIQAAVTGIDLAVKEIGFAERAPLAFDLLSINTGICPDLSTPGAADFATPVKPIAEFYPRWYALRQHLRGDVTEDAGRRLDAKPYRIAIVGGGAAGVELILAMHFALTKDSAIKRPVEFRLIQQGEGLPENYPLRVQQEVAELFARHQIQVSANTRVDGVHANALEGSNGEQVFFDTLFWCTNASAALWPGETGLAIDDQGFIVVNQYLQSSSHEFVFAAGDIAQQQGFPRPRAGVFAVRQGPVLFANLRRFLLHKPLKSFRPQTRFLSLLACGEDYAIGCRPGSALPSFSGHWVWRWKDRIDRRFMRMFSALSMPSGILSINTDLVSAAISGEQYNDDITSPVMRCGGCGAKVGAAVLNRVMRRLKPIDHDGVVLGLQTPDDASVIRIPPGQLLVQSVDIFRALVDDPYVLGQLSAEHALSDLFAMNAVPHSALAIATLPYAGETIVERDLWQMMSGAITVLNHNNCALIGGHTSEGAELSIGFAVNGLAAEGQVQTKQPQLGHCLILSQALGTGTLFAAHAQLRARGVWIAAATAAMLQSNREAGRIFYHHHASACTDITGFGLLGHLLEILVPSSHGATIVLQQVPALDGALECFEQGISSSLQPQNIRLRRAIVEVERWSQDPVYPLLFDPQTSGGLLASVPAEAVDSCLRQLHNAGYHRACVIGSITPPVSASSASSALAETGDGLVCLQ